MKPTSEDEARRRLTSAGFEIRGEKILLPLGRRETDVSESEADCINFLDQECGYGFDVRVRPQPAHERYIHWHQADTYLKQCRFTISYDQPSDEITTRKISGEGFRVWRTK
jgi:hypothetical protein